MAEEKDLTVKDKRKGFADGPQPEEDKEQGTGATCDANMLFNELGFSTFILSLSTSALVQLSELPDPITNKKQMNLSLARQTISVIELLKEKTKGNLTVDEERLIETVLYDLRLKYVKAAC
jgi:hypothetical protein